MRRDQRNGGAFAPAPTMPIGAPTQVPPPRAGINGNPYSNADVFTSANWGNGQAQDIYGHMGFGASTVRGDNAAGSILGQRFAPLLGSRVQSQMLFGNDMEAGRQAMLRRFIRANSAGGRQSKLAAFSQGVNSSLASRAPLNDALLRSLGAGSGIREGAMLDQANQASSRIHDYNAQLYSPEYDMRELMPMMQAYAAAQGSDLGSFMDVYSAMESNSQYRRQMANQGGVLNSVTPFLGMAAQAYMSRPPTQSAPIGYDNRWIV